MTNDVGAVAWFVWKLAKVAGVMLLSLLQGSLSRQEVRNNIILALRRLSFWMRSSALQVEAWASASSIVRLLLVFAMNKLKDELEKNYIQSSSIPNGNIRILWLRVNVKENFCIARIKIT